MGCELEVPLTPSLGLINFLQQLTELRETYHLLDFQFSMKGYSSRRASGRDAPPPGMVLTPRLHHSRSSSDPFLWGFVWRLHHVGLSPPKFHFHHFSFLKGMGVGVKNANFPSWLGLSGDLSSSRNPTQHCLIRTKDTLIPQ